VRLDPAEVPALPLATCLRDLDGRPVVASPEWAGPCPGTLTYHTGQGHLLVAPDQPAIELDGLMGRLLAAVREAAKAMGGQQARRAAVFAAGLELMSGRPPSGQGTVAEAVDLAMAAIAARTQGLTVTVEQPVPNGPVPAPAAVALALVQLAVNAQQHEEAPWVKLRVAAGPTFYVEWPGSDGLSTELRSHRHVLRRDRWGWGYVQMVADALGGSALPAGPTGPACQGASLGLGAARFALPVAFVRGGRVERATLAWDQDPDVPGFGQPLGGVLSGLVQRAEANPGRIEFYDLYRARSTRGRTWIALSPESDSARAVDLLRGMAHEQALWSAHEPHATRVHALTALLAGALGDPLPAVPPSVWEEGLPEACAALGLEVPRCADAVIMPDPRLAAFLLSEAGGRLVTTGDEVRLEAADHPLLIRLRRDPSRLVHLVGSGRP
jgi:hypothetical protein